MGASPILSSPLLFFFVLGQPHHILKANHRILSSRIFVLCSSVDYQKFLSTVSVFAGVRMNEHAVTVVATTELRAIGVT